MKRLALATTAALLVAACAAPPRGERPRVLGATERIHVVEAGLDFVAVVDTGARRTSIHALDLRIERPARRMRDNVGKRIRFRVADVHGRTRRIESRVAAVEPVRSAHGTNWRYVVPLRLRWNGIEKAAHVSLRDRSAMPFKLRIGRDWIRGDFLVDVGRNSVDAPAADRGQ